MSRFAVFAVAIFVFVLSSWSADGSIGTSSVCENAQCVVWASSSPVSILLSMALTAFVLIYPQRVRKPDETSVVGIWRRFGAFFLDSALVVLIVSSLGAVPLLIAEAHFTGVFQWAFERDFARPTDTAYVLELLEGGLTMVERRALRELASGAGARDALVWEGRELADSEVGEERYTVAA